MADQDALLTTIEAIHATALDASAWPDALAAMAELFGASAATVESYEGSTGALLWLRAHNIPPANQLDYSEHYAVLNPRAAFGMREPNLELLWDYRILDEAGMNRDPYYCEFLTGTGHRYFMSGVIKRDAREVAVITIQRTRTKGHVEPAQIALMGRILPHLRQAVDVSSRLRHMGAQNAALTGALDSLHDGVALLSAAGAVHYANTAMLETARRNDGLRLANRTIEFTSAAAVAAMERALGAAGAGGTADLPADFPAERRSGDPPYIVSVRRLIQTERRDDHGGHAEIIVFIRDPLRGGAPGIGLLEAGYGLTRAEQDLAAALQRGMSPVTYARERRLSLNTVYTHLRRLKEKTGTTRLAQLTAMLAALRVSGH